MKKFEVIVPAYKNPTDLAHCLNGLDAQTYKDFRVWICLHGDTSIFDSVFKDKVFSFPYKILFPPDKKHLERTANRNQALPYLEYLYTVYLDSDLIPESDFLEKHLHLLSAKDVISVGEVKYMDVDNCIWARYLSTRGKNKYNKGAEIPFQYLNTQNVALKTSFIKEVGGMDENIRNYGGDDIELAYRLDQRFSAMVIFNANAMVSGVMKKSLEFALTQMEEFGRISLPYIINKHKNFDAIFKISHYHKLSRRMLANSLFYKIANGIAILGINRFSLPAIHYMVFYRIRKGYFTSKNS